jgi:mutual gliding-motility protein MglA
VPHTFQWNKRDLSDLVPTEELDRKFNALGAPSLGTVATRGEGIFEGLERIARLVLKSYENDPKVRIGPAGADQTGPKLEEDGIAKALRGMENAGVEAPTKVSQVIPENVGIRKAPVEVRSAPPERAAAEQERRSSPSGASGTMPSGAAPPTGSTSQPAAKGSVPGASSAAASSTPVSSATASGGGFSVAELWPEPDRDGVRQAEAMLGARDAVNAILACDVLVTRVLASAAGLVGTLDAPRDPAVVSLLLGLDGARYFQFRMVVRAARHREPVTMRDALECLTFALEARRAREALRR